MKVPFWLLTIVCCCHVLLLVPKGVDGWATRQQHQPQPQRRLITPTVDPRCYRCGDNAVSVFHRILNSRLQSDRLYTKSQMTRLFLAPSITAAVVTTTTTTTLLSLVQPVGLILFHVLGGLLGVPFVTRGTNKPDGVDPKDETLGGWYSRIRLPSWTPPNKLFAPVWTLLYASMGWSLHLVLEHPKIVHSPKRPVLIGMWAIHYLSNLVWAPVFFGLQRLRLGLFINYWLTLSLTLWIVLVGHFYQTAGLILLPYLGWLVFATFLNLAIVRLNPTVNGLNEARFQAQLLKLRKKASEYADGK